MCTVPIQQFHRLAVTRELLTDARKHLRLSGIYLDRSAGRYAATPKFLPGASEGMQLCDLRRLCIRRQLRVAFNLNSGEDCCINEHGATLISGTAGWLSSAADFGAAREFRMTETATGRFRIVTRLELQKMVGGQPAPAAASARKRHSLLQLQE